MSNIFKPHRGKKSTMSGSKSSLVLEEGELFLEYPNTGVGKGTCNIKIGDGSTKYSSLPYAINTTSIENNFNNYYKKSDLSQVVRYSILDLKNLDTSYFYPVTTSGNTDLIWDCEIHSPNLQSSADYNQNMIHFRMDYAGWSDTPKSFIIYMYGIYSPSGITIGCIGAGSKEGTKCVWLRGGMYYRLISNLDLTIRTEAYSTRNSETFTIGTNYYGGSDNTNVNILFTPQQTILKGMYSENIITSKAGFSGNLSGNATGLSDGITLDCGDED